MKYNKLPNELIEIICTDLIYFKYIYYLESVVRQPKICFFLDADGDRCTHFAKYFNYRGTGYCLNHCKDLVGFKKYKFKKVFCSNCGKNKKISKMKTPCCCNICAIIPNLNYLLEL